MNELRESRREELAKLLDRDPQSLPDPAHLHADLALDSLAMMQIHAWLEGYNIDVAPEPQRLRTIGEVLSLVDSAPVPRIRVTGPQGDVLGPAELPPRDPLAPVLEDRAVRLDPVLPDDVGFLFGLMAQPDNCYRWRYRGAPPPFERFAADLWTGVMVQFVARRVADNQPLGHVMTYGAHPTLHHCYMGAVFLPRLNGGGLPARTTARFVRYLFHTFPFMKIYLEVPGFNWDQMRSGDGRLFTVEGVLRDHSYHAGRYWDEYICAIYREGAGT